jgi:NADH:ubiquinone oxidoreductase subunit 2 (subunit N)
VLGIVFVAAGVAFKLAAVPFHMWTPDVYERERSEHEVLQAGFRGLHVVAMEGGDDVSGERLQLDYFQRERIDRFEYPILIVLCTVGMLVMASANDLISLYLGSAPS